jgi:hypothetical protein
MVPAAEVAHPTACGVDDNAELKCTPCSTMANDHGHDTHSDAEPVPLGHNVTGREASNTEKAQIAKTATRSGVGAPRLYRALRG